MYRILMDQYIIAGWIAIVRSCHYRKMKNKWTTIEVTGSLWITVVVFLESLTVQKEKKKSVNLSLSLMCPFTIHHVIVTQPGTSVRQSPSNIETNLVLVRSHLVCLILYVSGLPFSFSALNIWCSNHHVRKCCLLRREVWECEHWQAGRMTTLSDHDFLLMAHHVAASVGIISLPGVCLADCRMGLSLLKWITASLPKSWRECALAADNFWTAPTFQLHVGNSIIHRGDQEMVTVCLTVLWNRAVVGNLIYKEHFNFPTISFRRF